MYAVGDTCMAHLELFNPDPNRPKLEVDQVKLAKEVSAHMPIFLDKPEVGNNRPSFCWTVLDHIKQNGASIDGDDNVWV